MDFVTLEVLDLSDFVVHSSFSFPFFDGHEGGLVVYEVGYALGFKIWMVYSCADCHVFSRVSLIIFDNFKIVGVAVFI